MPGLVGFYDPQGSTGSDLLARMLRPLMQPGLHCEIAARPWGGIGVIDHETSLGGGRIHRGSTSVFAYLGGISSSANGSPGDGSPADGITPRASRVAAAAELFGGRPLDEALAAARGHFAASVLVDEERTLHVVTDHLGLHPLYTARVDRRLLFASQQKSLLATGLFEPHLDRGTLHMLVSIGEAWGNATLIEEIELMPAGSHLVAGLAGVHAKRYWTFEYVPSTSLRWSESVEQVGRALTDATLRGCGGHAGVCVPLSGGLDSRFLADVASRELPITTFTWGEPGCRDRLYAAEVARKLGCAAQDYTFDETYLARLASTGAWITEGLFSSTNFHVLPFVDEVARTGSAVLDGLFGDALLGGNLIGRGWGPDVPGPRAASALWSWRLHGWWKDAHPLIRTQPLADPIAEAARRFEEAYLEYPGGDSTSRAMAFLLDNRMRRNVLNGALLFRTRMSTEHPFVDVSFVDAIRRLPHAWRKHHRFYLAVLRRYARRSSRARWQRTALPASLPYTASWLSLASHRVARALAPRVGVADPFPHSSPCHLDRWMRGGLAGYVRELLLSERTLDRGWIPADSIRRAVEAHLAARVDASGFLGSAISVELFARQFFDDLSGSIETCTQAVEVHEPATTGRSWP